MLKKRIYFYLNKLISPFTTNSNSSVFELIINKQIPSEIIYEDDQCLAFKDINPIANKHFLLIPKNHQGLTQLSKAIPEHKQILGHLLYVSSIIAKQQSLNDGFRIMINDGKQGGQTVYHLHLHIIGGQQLGWPGVNGTQKQN